jgi:hypothetical protein
MVSKRPGAYKHAHKKSQTAEDKYFKTLYDIDKLESRQQFLQRHGPKILAMNGDIAAEYTNHQCNKNSEVVTERLMALQKALRQYIDESPITAASSSISEALAGYSGNSQQMLKDLSMESEKPKMITLARKLNSILPTESTSVQTQLSAAKKESDEALRQVGNSVLLWNFATTFTAPINTYTYRWRSGPRERLKRKTMQVYYVMRR